MIKHFLNQFHIGKHHFQFWDTLNDKPSFHYSYQTKHYWNSDPHATRHALAIDDLLGIEHPKKYRNSKNAKGKE